MLKMKRKIYKTKLLSLSFSLPQTQAVQTQAVATSSAASSDLSTSSSTSLSRPPPPEEEEEEVPFGFFDPLSPPPPLTEMRTVTTSKTRTLRPDTGSVAPQPSAESVHSFEEEEEDSFSLSLLLLPQKSAGPSMPKRGTKTTTPLARTPTTLASAIVPFSFPSPSPFPPSFLCLARKNSSVCSSTEALAASCAPLWRALRFSATSSCASSGFGDASVSGEAPGGGGSTPTAAERRRWTMTSAYLGCVWKWEKTRGKNGGGVRGPKKTRRKTKRKK